jgi:hypothetical protein
LASLAFRGGQHHDSNYYERNRKDKTYYRQHNQADNEQKNGNHQKHKANCCEDDKAAFCQVNTSFALQKLGHVGCGSSADDDIRKPPIGQLEDNPAGIFIVGDQSMSGRANACYFPTPKAQIIIYGKKRARANSTVKGPWRFYHEWLLFWL